MSDMTLYHAGPSPFARKVRIVALETGLMPRIELIEQHVAPGKENVDYARDTNPLKRVPAMRLEDGSTLLDSGLICTWLDEQAGGQLVPASGEPRWRVLNALAVADGLTELAVAMRYETFVRPEDKRWDAWSDDQRGKILNALDWLEAHADDVAHDVPDLAGIAIVCGLDYLDFRHPTIGWREGRERLAGLHAAFAEREAFKSTMPV